jgi:hypothetical protein
MPVEILRWMVLVVVLYAAAIMFQSAMAGRRERRAEHATAHVTGRVPNP